MSFSSDIKKELCDVRELSPQQAEAMLYGIMYASRMDEGRPLIQTENIDLMNAAAELIRAVFPNVRTGIVRLVKNSGGHSIAVYNPDQKGARKEMASLIHDNRVSHVCPADYSEGSDMDILVKTIIDKIDLDDRLEKLEVVK